MKIAITRTFTEALGDLGAPNVRQAIYFVSDLLRDDGSASSETELMRDDDDRSVQVLRVGEELRAIARTDSDEMLLLYLGRSDDAYGWARSNCFDCLSPNVGLRVAPDEIPGRPVIGLPAMRLEGPWYCVLSGIRDLYAVLDAADISH
jgi:hypothetical protein